MHRQHTPTPTPATNTDTPAGLCACGCGKPTPIARNTRYGNIKGEPVRYLRGHVNRRRWQPEPGDPGRVRIPLTRGLYATIDRADLDTVRPHNWSARPSRNTWYAQMQAAGRIVSMHRLIAGAAPGIEVDHRDGDGLNNTRENLRAATRSRNTANTPLTAANTTGYKGISLDRKSGRWRAEIKHAKNRRSLGYHDTPEDAARAYDAAARELHGAYAALNFPQDGERSAR